MKQGFLPRLTLAPSYGETGDFLMEVAKGNIPGHSFLTVSGRAPAIGTSFVDVTEVGELHSLGYDAQTVAFTIGATLTGSTSSATGIIVINDNAGASGTLTIRKVNGDFQDDELITDGSGGSADADGIDNNLGIISLPTVGSQWEIFTENAGDDIAGIGARTVFLQYLDDQFAEQTTIIDLSGAGSTLTTPTNILRFRRMLVIAWGSNIDLLFGKSNLGYIVIRDGADNPQGAITFDDRVPSDSHGFNVSRSSIATIPAGRTGFLQQITVNTAKNQEAETVFMSRPFGSEGFLAAAEQNIYQNSIDVKREAPGGLSQKSDIKFIARSTNANVIINITYDLLLIDDDELDHAGDFSRAV